MRRTIATGCGALLLAAAALGQNAAVTTQNIFAAPDARPAAPPPPPAKPGFSLKGHWVAVVTEDWRFRMVVPPKGDYASVPINAEGKKIADQWDPAKDAAQGEACKAYGAGNLMRMPLRLNISENPDGSWRLESDHGQQVRTWYFTSPPPSAAPSWQGDSHASWDGNVLNVVTKNVRAGYLRTNGVPYSEHAVITESIIRHSEGAAGEWFTVSTVVDDPTYLREPFITSSSFKRIDNDKDWHWHPGPCESHYGPLKERNFADPFKL